jgi:hypothetical protein
MISTRVQLLRFSAFACGIVFSFLFSAHVFAQGGTTGGIIGKEGKSISGGEEQPESRRRASAKGPRALSPAKSSELKPQATGSVCTKLINATWSSWASGMFGGGDTTFNEGGTAAHRSGINGTWSCTGSKIYLQWPGEAGPRPMTMTADGKRLLGEQGQLRFTRN